MSNAVKHLYEFGLFQLDPAERRLRRGSERIDLPPRVFDTLLALVESDGRLLSKDELMDRIWPDSTVEENNLTQAIYLLRRVLQESENGTRYIETVPKRGYRFIGAVRHTESSPARAAALASPPLPPHQQNGPGDLPPSEPGAPLPFPRASNRSLWIALSMLAVLAGSMLSFLWRSLLSRPTPAGSIRSIAVLPLQNLSNDESQEYFADGMTDELITDLAQIRELKVVSKTSIMQYRGTVKSLPQIGKELGVDAVVEGSVLRSGDRVRITAQLIRANTDTHIWAQSYEGDLKNILSLQASVAESITSEVRLNLSTEERNRLHLARNYNPEAYDLYLRGRYAFRGRNVPAFREAMGYYEKAAALDPKFALAYTGLSDCYTLLALFGDGYRWVPDATANAQRAIALDDSLAEAHRSLAAAYVLQWNWKEAEREFGRTLELNPNDAQAHQWYGNLFLGPMGRHTEAISELRRALDLDPLSAIINTDLGFAYFLAGQYDAALQQYRNVIATDSNFLPAHYDLILYYQQRGMHHEAIQELIEDMKLAGNPEAARAIERLSGNPKKLYVEMVSPGGMLAREFRAPGLESRRALPYLWLGDKQSALAALQKAVESRDTELIYLKVDPDWAPLRDDSRFQELERKVGLL
jgi:TolB-like protein/DNA-binding winged helix-turn-helix (wHTH) protein